MRRFPEAIRFTTNVATPRCYAAFEQGDIRNVVGAGAGTAGSAYTEEKEIVVPAGSALSFKLTDPVSIKM
jgi:hypothetical protein